MCCHATAAQNMTLRRTSRYDHIPAVLPRTVVQISTLRARCMHLSHRDSSSSMPEAQKGRRSTQRLLKDTLETRWCYLTSGNHWTRTRIMRREELVTRPTHTATWNNHGARKYHVGERYQLISRSNGCFRMSVTSDRCSIRLMPQDVWQR